MNPLDKNEIISEQIWNVVKDIIEACPTAVFGGSIALNAVGLLNRPVKDIDVFFDKNEGGFNRQGALSIKNMGIEGSEDATDVNGNLVQRMSITVNDVKCCCFKVDWRELEHSTIIVRGTTIKIQNVNHAIRAKMSYADRSGKHKNDLDVINTILQHFIP